MYISKLSVRNWKNFSRFEVDLGEANFLIGPNASGKSNFLDIFRFMRDVVNPTGGGLQQALSIRHGLQKVRCLAARNTPQVELDFHFRETRGQTVDAEWRYFLSITAEKSGRRRPTVLREEVFKDGEKILSRPMPNDMVDKEQLTVTYLEQVHLNKDYRCIAEYFQDVLYLHLVPQLLKYSVELSPRKIESDPFGQGFLEEIAKTPSKAQEARLRHVNTVLHNVIPHFEEIRFVRDEGGRPHLEMRYAHWRPNAGWQREDQFSDGTLRLIAIIWILLSNRSMILLEEPELSLNEEIVAQIPQLIHEARKYIKKAGGQLVISTHSKALLSDKSIDANYMILKPGMAGESTKIEVPSEAEVGAMMAGLSPADVLLPKTGTLIGLFGDE